MSDEDIDDDVVAQFFANLSDREKEVLNDRFGVDLSGATNREIVSAMYEIKREKIESFELRALKKLKGKDEG